MAGAARLLFLARPESVRRDLATDSGMQQTLILGMTAVTIPMQYLDLFLERQETSIHICSAAALTRAAPIDTDRPTGSNTAPLVISAAILAWELVHLGAIVMA